MEGGKKRLTAATLLSPCNRSPFSSVLFLSLSSEGERERARKEEEGKERKSFRSAASSDHPFPMFLISSVVARDKFIRGYYGLLSRQIAFLRDYNAAELGR